MSMHQLGLQELLAIVGFQASLPRKIVLWGIEPATIEPGVGLTETVAAQIDRLVDAIVEKLRSWELAVEPRPVYTPLGNEP
jgi:hydrogenase maturation protease